jgi:hypothetical protein
MEQHASGVMLGEPMKALDLTPYTMDNGQVESFAWPGGYPVFFMCEDNGVLCPACVNENRKLIDVAERDQDKQWNVVATGINYEDDSLYCDHCNKQIESAYGEDNS